MIGQYSDPSRNSLLILSIFSCSEKMHTIKNVLFYFTNYVDYVDNEKKKKINTHKIPQQQQQKSITKYVI